MSSDQTLDPDHTPVNKHLYRPWAVASLRVLVGVIFLISGFVKSVDIWGFIFKIEEYLAAWDIHQPRTIVLVIAIAICAYELIAGAMLLCGCWKRRAPWVLLLPMIVMLPLTAYIWVANPVNDCGCFGEFIHLSNAATFWKNVLLTAAIIYLIRYNAKLSYCIFKPAIQPIVALLMMIYVICVALYGFNFQPTLDFRPYPIGFDLYASLQESSSSDVDDIDEVEMQMLYERDGVQQVFDIDNLPDSTWTFVERIETTISAVDNETFTIYDIYGDDVTEYAIEGSGTELLLVIPEADRVDIAGSYSVNELYKAVQKEGGSLVALLGSSTNGVRRWIDMSMATYPCYIVEDTYLKQLARGSMSIVALNDGQIKWKRNLLAIDFATIDALSDGSLKVSDLQFDDKHNLLIFTLITVAVLLLMVLIRYFMARLLLKKQKKDVNLQSQNTKS